MAALPTIGCVILGAGFSRRFGRDKRIELLDRETVAATTLARYCPVFSNVRLVLRPEDNLNRLGIDLPNHPNLEIVRAPLAHQGMGHSLSAGFTDLDWTWAFVALLDMPYVAQKTLAGLFTHAQNSTAPLIQPRLTASGEQPLERKHGHPIGIHRQLFHEVRASSGDEGARRLVKHRAKQIDYFDCSDTGIIQDIDYPTDLPQ